MKVCCDIVSDNSGCNKCGPDKYGSDKCGFHKYGSDKWSSDMVSGKICVTVSDNAGFDKHSSKRCTLICSDNPSCDECNWQLRLWDGVWIWLPLTKCQRWHWIPGIPAKINRSNQYSISCYMIPKLDTGWVKNWLSSPLGTSGTDTTNEELSTMLCTIYSASQQMLIPLFLFSITDNKLSQSCMNNTSWHTVCNISPPLALASPVLIWLRKWMV